MRLAAAVLTCVLALCALPPGPAAAADPGAPPAAGPGETPTAAVEALIADGRAKREDAVRARLSVPPGEAAREELDDLIDAVAGGMFSAFEIRVLGERAEGDAAVVVAEFRRSGRRPDINRFYLLRDRAGAPWKVLPSADLQRFVTLPEGQKNQLADLAKWYEQRREELRLKPPDPAAMEKAEAQRKLNTGLALAAVNGDVAEVERLIKAGADVNGGAYMLDSPLMAVVERNNLDMIRLLVSKGADVNAPGEPLLFGAVQNGKPETAKLLVELGTDVNRSHQRDTALGIAARMGKSDVVKVLLEAKADPRPPRGMGGPLRQTTLLNLAASSGDLATFELVRPYFPDLKVTDEQGRNALHAVGRALAFSEGKDHAAIIAALLNAGVDPHARMRDDELTAHYGLPIDTPLRMAAIDHRPAVLDALLAGVKYEPAELTFVLPLAIRRHAPAPTVRRMLELGADPNAPAKATGRTPLHEAVAGASAEVVEVLLAGGADPSLKDAKGADAVALAEVRASKGRQLYSAPDKYLPEFDESPDAGARVLKLVRARVAPR